MSKKKTSEKVDSHPGRAAQEQEGEGEEQFEAREPDEVLDPEEFAYGDLSFLDGGDGEDTDEGGPGAEQGQGPETSHLPALLPMSVPPAAAGTELARYDPLRSYLNEIRHLPTLTREEEHELAVRYHKYGDKAAGYKLVLANLRLVVMIAREYQRNVQNVLDLVQEGNIGLLEAVKKFDPFRGIRFPSYAVYWVRAYMLRYLIANVRLVKIGTTQAQRKLFFNLVKEKEKLEKEGYVPEAKMLAERLKVKESEVLEMEQRLALPDLSVDAPLGVGDEGGDFHNVLPSEVATAEELVVEEQFAGAVREQVERFKEHADEKERAIIDQRLLAEDPATLQVIADQFDVSRERIRQIEARLKERLKEYLTSTLGLNAEGEVSLEE
ncbi:MAG: RNA polymerase factor sigma-32 [Bdellovibrionales bacterium]|nr:RNA polymerase factor sigma-32 [Bdellovibrionales bacterium]